MSLLHLNVFEPHVATFSGAAQVGGAHLYMFSTTPDHIRLASEKARQLCAFVNGTTLLPCIQASSFQLVEYLFW